MAAQCGVWVVVVVKLVEFRNNSLGGDRPWHQRGDLYFDHAPERSFHHQTKLAAFTPAAFSGSPYRLLRLTSETSVHARTIIHAPPSLRRAASASVPPLLARISSPWRPTDSRCSTLCWRRTTPWRHRRTARRRSRHISFWSSSRSRYVEEGRTRCI
jgi:hypothetical protein